MVFDLTFNYFEILFCGEQTQNNLFTHFNGAKSLVGPLVGRTNCHRDRIEHFEFMLR